MIPIGRCDERRRPRRCRRCRRRGLQPIRRDDGE